MLAQRTFDAFCVILEVAERLVSIRIIGANLGAFGKNAMIVGPSAITMGMPEACCATNKVLMHNTTTGNQNATFIETS